MRKKLLICLRMCVKEASVRNRKQEAERASQNQECEENKCSGAEERTKDACSPQKQLLSLLSSCPPHQLTQLQQTSPMEWKAQLPSAQYFSYGPCIRHYFLLAAAHTLQHHNSTIIN